MVSPLRESAILALATGEGAVRFATGGLGVTGDFEGTLGDAFKRDGKTGELALLVGWDTR